VTAVVELIRMLVLLLLLEEEGSRRLDFAEDRRWDRKENWATPRKEDIVNMLDYVFLPKKNKRYGLRFKRSQEFPELHEIRAE
jgi:hypothetical protein